MSMPFAVARDETGRPVDCCAVCRFFEFNPVITTKGWCRETAPVGTNHSAERPWPVLNADDWCGAFESYTPPPEPEPEPLPPPPYVDFTPTVTFNGANVGMVTSGVVGRYQVQPHGGFMSYCVRVRINVMGTSTGELWIDGLPAAAINVPADLMWLPASFISGTNLQAMRAYVDTTGRLRAYTQTGTEPGKAIEAKDIAPNATLTFAGMYPLVAAGTSLADV